MYMLCIPMYMQILTRTSVSTCACVRVCGVCVCVDEEAGRGDMDREADARQ